MAGERWFNPRALATELFVVFVGLVAALQVDEWRERREAAHTETVYLQRLDSDLRAYTEDLKAILPALEARRKAVEHVQASLVRGEIIDGNAALFESGLVFVGHLPILPASRAAYDEMVASGVFARLRSPDLQQTVSSLYATQAMVDANFGWWREQPLQLEREMQPFIEYYSDGSARVPSTMFDPGTEGRRVRFDFAGLHGSRSIRNGYFWAEDTHGDWVEWAHKLLDLATEASAIVAAELTRRT